MSKRPSLRRRVGDLLAIPLGTKRFGFALVLENPLLAFFDCCHATEEADVASILTCPVVFKLWVMKNAMTSGRWLPIGHCHQIPAALLNDPWFFKKDPISGCLTITRDGGSGKTATIDECQGLERAAVWDPEHVEDRLRDHFAGVPNKWVESLKCR